MRMVGAREANQQFSRLLKAAEKGEEIHITRNGKVVARLSPPRTARDEKERKKAVEEMMKIIRKGIDLGGRRYTRDEMHEG